MSEDEQLPTTLSDIDEELDQFDVVVNQSKQTINKTERPGLLKSKIYHGFGAFDTVPNPSDREVIDSNIEAMLENSKREARQHGLESTLDKIWKYNQTGERIGGKLAGEDAESCTALKYAYEIELDIQYYKDLLVRFDELVLDSESRRLVEQLVAKMLRITRNHHLMWVADHERYILAGISNLKASQGASVERRQAAVTRYKELKRQHPEWRVGVIKQAVSDEMGGIPRSTLDTWIRKYE